ncbi:MAG TPA: NAD(P)-binding domain-containing protein [Gemmatimonadaceae bacterium]|nr:NAD(P)-binding domain-containing protein [Gemmatimonadaceae bacterium]
MNVGVLGSGPVAQVLGAGFIKHGHSVMLGTRDANKLGDWARDNGGKVGSFADAAAFGELIVLAVKGTVAEEVMRMAGEGVNGKVVMDTTNPIAPAPPVNGVLSFFTTLSDSLMERLQNAWPKARFVKAFNSVGNTRMVNPSFADGQPTMFICGNDDTAKQIVSAICEQFGWDVHDLGKAEAARAIEPLCILWCIPGFLRNEWTHAYKVLHR